MSTRSVAVVALLAALVAALGFVLSGVPNVELASLGAFVSGAAVGSRRGAAAGGIGMALYSSLNPYGAAPPPTFLAQIAGGAVFGAAGGRTATSQPLTLGALGLVLTFVYDGLTNLGTAFSIGAGRDPWPILVGGWAFGVWHVAWNVLFFAVLGPPLLGAIRRWKAAGA